MQYANILKLETCITYTLVAFHKLEIKMGFLVNDASIETWGSSIGMKTSSPNWTRKHMKTQVSLSS